MNKTLGIIFLFHLCITLHCQTNEGTEFWLGTYEYFNDGRNIVIISSRYNTSGKIEIPGLQWSSEFEVVAGEYVTIELPIFGDVSISEIIENRGVRITSDKLISTFFHNFTLKGEATVILPVHVLGLEHYVMSFSGSIDLESNDIQYSRFLIVATQDDTEVLIELGESTLGGHQQGDFINITLDQGEIYMVKAQDEKGDLTGTSIKSDKKVAVFSGSDRAMPIQSCLANNRFIEQMVSKDKWGNSFIAGISVNADYDIFRIFAAEDDTEVIVSSMTLDDEVIYLNKGEFEIKNYGTAKLMRSNKPIQVQQILNFGACFIHNFENPSMIMLSSLSQAVDTVEIFSSPYRVTQEHYIHIIAFTSDIPSITIDGNPIPNSANIEQVDKEGLYSSIRMSTSEGVHTIISGGCGIIVTAYGFGWTDSYAYSGLGRYSPVNPIVTDPIPDGGCLNDTLFFDTGLRGDRYEFIWNLGDGEISTAPSFSKFYHELGTYPVQLIIKDLCAAKIDTFQKDIEITLREAVNTLDDVSLCEGASFDLGATDVEEASYLWKGPQFFTSEEQFPQIENSKPYMSGSYEVIGIVSGCATYPAYVNVEIFPSPQPEFINDTVFCNAKDELILNPGQFEAYIWHNGSTDNQLKVLTDGIYEVTVTDNKGCEETASINLTEFCPSEFFIPNVFSPNDDGINDEWQIFGNEIIEMSVIVKSRWGEVVFFSDEVDSSWDGRFQGIKAEAGVYFYHINIKSNVEEGTAKEEQFVGTITLLR